MGGSGRARFGGFIILWSKPNSTRYKKKLKKKIVTQPNHQALKIDPTQRVGSVQVGFGGFSAHPYIPYS